MAKSKKQDIEVGESNQSLSKSEKKAKDFIDVGFKPHDGPWMDCAKRLKDYYRGKYYSGEDNKKRFIVNTLFSLVNLMLPSFAFNSPYVKVRPLQPKFYKKLVDGAYEEVDNDKAAKKKEAAINHLYLKNKTIKEQRDAIFDSLFYGFGISKVGYSYETSSYNDKDYIVKDTPFLRRVDPKDFGWHPLATNLSDSQYLVHRTLTTISQLKKNKNLKNVDMIKPEIPTYLKDRFKNSDLVKKGDWCPQFEVHDQDTDDIFTFGGTNYILLEKRKDPYEFDGPHFSMIKFASDPDQFEGIPLLAAVEDEAMALNEVMTLMVEHFRKFPGAVYVEEGTIDADDIQRIRNGEIGSIHTIGDIAKIKFQPPLSMGQEYFQIINILQNLIDRILGIPDFQRLTSTNRKSATEAALIQGDVSVRKQYLMLLVKEFMLDGIEKMSSVQAQFQTEEETIEATGDLHGTWYTYDKEDLQLKSRVDFDLDTLQATNESRTQALVSALQAVSSQPLLQPVVRTLDPMKIGKLIFSGLGMNIESVQASSSEHAVFVKPEMENEMARKGKPMPNPKEGEEHEYHEKIHKEDLITKGWNQQIAEHLAETIMLRQQEKAGGAPPQPAPPPIPGMLGQPEMMAPPGPEGPMQSEVALPPPGTSPEIA